MTILRGVLNPSAALVALIGVLLFGTADAASWSRSIIMHSKIHHGPWGVGGAQVSSSSFSSGRPLSFVVRGGSMESMAEEEDEAPVDNGGEGDNDDGEEEAVAQEKVEETPVVEKTTEEASEVPDEDEDSSANIDSMDYADAYDEEVEGG